MSFKLSITYVRISLVGDGLGASVGKVDVVRSRCVSLAIARLGVTHVVVVIVLHIIGESVRVGDILNVACNNSKNQVQSLSIT